MVHLVEIEQFYGHIFVILEKFFSSRDVVLVDVDPNNLRILECVNDAVERVTGSSTNVQHCLGLGLVAIGDPSICGPGLEQIFTW